MDWLIVGVCFAVIVIIAVLIEEAVRTNQTKQYFLTSWERHALAKAWGHFPEPVVAEALREHRRKYGGQLDNVAWREDVGKLIKTAKGH